MSEMHQSLSGYFEKIGDKSYIDKYPQEIINLLDLKGVIIEFGAGVGNDAKFLIKYLGVNPQNLFFVESDPFYSVSLRDNLEDLLGDAYYSSGRFEEEVLRNNYPDGLADFIYANNFLHCLGFKTMKEEVLFSIYNIANQIKNKRPEISENFISRLEPMVSIKQKDKVRLVVEEAYRLLKSGGVFFGRTLSKEIDNDKLKLIKEKKNKTRDEIFSLETADALNSCLLIGLSEYQLGEFCINAGFNRYFFTAKNSGWKPTKDFYFRAEKSL